MHEIPLKAAASVAVATVSGAASTLTEQTLIPLGIFVTVSVVLVAAAWKVSSTVTRALDKLNSLDSRIQEVERKIQNL